MTDFFDSPVTTRPVTQPRWRYVVADLLTDQHVADLALTGVKFDRRVSRAGAFEGKMSIANRYQAQIASQIAEQAGRLAIWAIRNGKIWWGGVLWTATPAGVGARGAETMQIQGATFESYAARRIIRTGLSYSQIDQGVIMPALWRDLQSFAHGDIGVIALDQPTGILRDRTYLASDVAYYEDRIEEIGDVIDGAEHTIDVYFDAAGNRVKQFRVGQLQLGQSGGDLPPPMRISGHRVPSYSRANDATTGGTTFQTRGATPGGNVGTAAQPLMSTVYEATDLLDAGWPLLDVTRDFTTVSDLGVLNNHAQADMVRYSGQNVTPTYQIYVEDSTEWTPNRIGETIIIKHSTRDLWNPGLLVKVRPVVVEITPGDSGEHEMIELTVADRSDEPVEEETA